MCFSKTSFSQKEVIKNSFKIIVFIIIFILFEYFCFKSSILTVWKERKWLDPNFMLVGLSFFVGVIFVLIWRYIQGKLDIFINDTVRRLKNALKGNRGEKKTFARLKEILGQEYKIYKNFKVPGTNFDNDLIILGPKGLIYIEIKNINGAFDFVGEETYRYDRHHGDESLCKLNEQHSPTKKVLWHCEHFERWLSNNGFKEVIIKRAILLVSDNIKIVKIENPAVYIISSLNNLADFIEKSYNDPLFTKEFCYKLDQLLSRK